LIIPVATFTGPAIGNYSTVVIQRLTGSLLAVSLRGMGGAEMAGWGAWNA
jgi:hypothetical protein